MRRLGLTVVGRVQGVGFRPYVTRLARELGLSGGVTNTADGLWIEVEGPDQELAHFQRRMAFGPPPSSSIDHTTVAPPLPVRGDLTFEIWPSGSAALDGTAITTAVPLDLAPCPECRAELFSPESRRYFYPFISCDQCGPRFSLAERLPFDRERTVMRLFPMCAACAAEYAAPHDRRFYAQTISCPDCGPILRWSQGMQSPDDEVPLGDQALKACVETLWAGGVVGLKGVGGYQLVAMAGSLAAIQRIRVLKQRSDKPLALMAPHLAAVESVVPLSRWEKDTLTSLAAPIVLLRRPLRRIDSIPLLGDPLASPTIMTSILGTSPFLGVMLPSSPLHLLLTHHLTTWLVVTSANGPGEPMEIDDRAMEARWAPSLDGLLAHNRPIVHRVDDSVVREGGDAGIVLRHARGLAPTPVSPQPGASPPSSLPVIALGGHQKAAVALGIPRGRGLILGPHVGDLNCEATCQAIVSSVRALQRLYGLDSQSPDSQSLDPQSLDPQSLDPQSSAVLWVADGHPHWGSGSLAASLGSTSKRVWHHDAHLESLMVESAFQGRALGVVWDGLGYRPGVPVAGGEFYEIDGQKRAHRGAIRPFFLMGGDRVAREPRRAAFGLLREVYGDEAWAHPYVDEHFSRAERSILKAADEGGIRGHRATSVGRLFEGMAALLGVCQKTTYEGEAACLLEDLAREGVDHASYEGLWRRADGGACLWDWEPLVVAACTPKVDPAGVAQAFHKALATAILEMAQKEALTTVLLTGGVMQNARLIDLCQRALGSHGIRLVTHRIVPPGDGGLSLGQAALARQWSERQNSVQEENNYVFGAAGKDSVFGP